MRLDDAMKDAGVKPADLARECGVTPQAVYDWQKTGRIGKQHLMTICRVLNKPLEYFLVGLGRAAAVAILALGMLVHSPSDAGYIFSSSDDFV